MQSLVRWLSAKTRLITARPICKSTVPGEVGADGELDVAAFSAMDRSGSGAATGRWLPQASAVLGRLVPVKGVSVLLAAMAQLAMEVPVELIVAGDGPSGLRFSTSPERLGLLSRFVGAVSGTEKQTLLWASDALVLPSLQLADGRTRRGARGAVGSAGGGCPVVASSVGGVAEQLQSAGLLTKPGEASSLLGALRQVLCDEKTADQLRAAGTSGASSRLVGDWAQAAWSCADAVRFDCASVLCCRRS